MGQALYSVQLEQKSQRAQRMSTPRRPRRDWWQHETTADIEQLVPRPPPNSASSLDTVRERTHSRDMPQSLTRSSHPHIPAATNTDFTPAQRDVVRPHPIFRSANRVRSWYNRPTYTSRDLGGSVLLASSRRDPGNDDQSSDDSYETDADSESDSESDAETVATTVIDEAEGPSDNGISSPPFGEKVHLGSTARGQEIYGVHVGDNRYVLV